MNIAKLNQKIDILKFKLIPDGYGGFIPERLKVASVWAHVQNHHFSENFNASTLQKKQVKKFTVNTNITIEENHGLIYAGDFYKIFKTKSLKEGLSEIYAFPEILSLSNQLSILGVNDYANS